MEDEQRAGPLPWSLFVVFLEANFFLGMTFFKVFPCGEGGGMVLSSGFVHLDGQRFMKPVLCTYC